MNIIICEILTKASDANHYLSCNMEVMFNFTDELHKRYESLLAITDKQV